LNNIKDEKMKKFKIEVARKVLRRRRTGTVISDQLKKKCSEKE
jgi:hypothetical protein